MIPTMKRTVAIILPAFGLLCWVVAGSAQDGKASPVRRDLELWAALKRSLSQPQGEEFFRDNLKDFALPVLAGTLISATPADRPSALVIGISDPSTPEVTLRLKDENGRDAHLDHAVVRGSEIRFEGAPVAFTKEPFMLTVEVSPNLGKPRRR